MRSRSVMHRRCPARYEYLQGAGPAECSSGRRMRQVRRGGGLPSALHMTGCRHSVPSLPDDLGAAVQGDVDVRRAVVIEATGTDVDLDHACIDYAEADVDMLDL